MTPEEVVDHFYKQLTDGLDFLETLSLPDPMAISHRILERIGPEALNQPNSPTLVSLLAGVVLLEMYSTYTDSILDFMIQTAEDDIAVMQAMSLSPGLLRSFNVSGAANNFLVAQLNSKSSNQEQQ